MTLAAVFQMLDMQKQLLLAAKARKGQRATNKMSRHQLSQAFRKELYDANERPYTIKSCMISHAYPPSTSTLSELRPITISHLRLETHHVGTVLIVRTFGHPTRFESVQNAVEDMNLDVDQLAVYDANPGLSAEHVLPRDAIFAVKEPYYKTSASGGYIIRVDHPTDLIRLDSAHAMVPHELQFPQNDQGASQYKSSGNVAFKEKRYAQAIEAYTSGLHACDEREDSLRHDLFRNRSLANIYLGRYEPAAEDAMAAYITEAGHERKEEYNIKALFRAGRAFYCLGNFAAAKSQFQQLLAISPADYEGQKHLELTNARIKETTTGIYDFVAMSKSITSTNKRVDRASFTGNVVLRAAGAKGRGLFATKDIKAGELVLVEKAFCAIFKSEAGPDLHWIMNLNTNTVRSGAHASLYYGLVQKALHNPDQARRLLDLFNGGYTPKCMAQMVDGATVIDTFQIAAIMEKNCFGCANTTSVDEMDMPRSSDSHSDSVGIWIVASYFNHACNANASRTFMGDCMIVRANRDILQGDEISIVYISAESDHSKTQAALEKVWNFKCTCKMCTAESNTPLAQRKERQQLAKELTAFLEKNSGARPHSISGATIAKARELYRRLDATYDSNVFQCLPRIPLAKLGAWLCNAYQTPKNHHKVSEAAQTVLRDLGNKVTVGKQSLHIDPTNCHSTPSDIDAAMHLAHASFRDGNMLLGKQYEDFAKGRYLVEFGEMRGFEGRYGK